MVSLARRKDAALPGQRLPAERLQAACDDAPDAVAALRNLLVAYASFAAGYPAHIRVMLRPELAEPDTHPDVITAGAAPVELVRATVIAAQREGALSEGDPEPMVHLFWSLAVGYVTLWVDGPVEARCGELGTTPLEMMRQVATAVEGLLRRPAA